ncbi:hypothetical protein AVEN_17252-1, partial [Araneus ventricosus]
MQYFLKVEKQRAICGDPGIPRDGSRLNPDGSDASDPRIFEEGESVIFSCNGESFALHGTSFITCLADGTWSAPRPRCINPPVETALGKEIAAGYTKEAKLDELLSLKSQLTEKLNELIKADESMQLKIEISQMAAEIASSEEYKDK